MIYTKEKIIRSSNYKMITFKYCRNEKENMKKTLRNLVGGALITGMSLGIVGSGCAKIYKESFVADLVQAHEKNKQEAEWKGTDIIKKDVYPNGDILFILKLKSDYWKTHFDEIAEYTNKFINENRYGEPEVSYVSKHHYSVTYPAK